jgi:hypothetical protein
VLGAATTNSLRVIVKDSSTGASLEGAYVYLIKGGDSSQEYDGYSGGSVWVQTDWTDGAGQTDWLPQPPGEKDKYFADNGNIDINSAPTGVRLRKQSGRYVTPGNLESSTFDTGTSNNNFSNIIWEPTSQHPATTLQFQIASSNDITGPWNYVGPDGTASTYYTVSGSSVSSAHDLNRYVRYKTFLSTIDDKYTPVLTGLYLNYVSGCATPGQVIFPGLTQGNNWHLEVHLAGYQTQVIDPLDISGNIATEVLLTP